MFGTLRCFFFVMYFNGVKKTLRPFLDSEKEILSRTKTDDTLIYSNYETSYLTIFSLYIQVENFDLLIIFFY